MSEGDNCVMLLLPVLIFAFLSALSSRQARLAPVCNFISMVLLAALFLLHIINNHIIQTVIGITASLRRIAS